MNEPPPKSNLRRLRSAPRILSATESLISSPDSGNCSFCKKSRKVAEYLIGNANARICDECLNRYSELLAQASSLTTRN